MSDYTVKYSGLDSGPSANTSRVVRIHDELAAIATAIATKANRIGTATSDPGWATSTYSALPIGYSTILFGHSSADIGGIGQNFYYSSGVHKRLHANYAQRVLANNGGWQFDVASSSTAGSTITWNTVFECLSSEYARAKNGILFGTDTADANALDDYEEGTWTPALDFGGGSTGITYSIQAGSYTKVGDIVHIQGRMTISNKGSSTGTARIGGLPFTIGSGNSSFAAVAMRIRSITYTGQTQAYGSPNSTYVYPDYVTEAGAVTSLTNSNFTNTSDIMLNFSYHV